MIQTLYLKSLCHVRQKINDVFVDEANHLHCNTCVNSIKYSNNYSDISGSLRKFERDEVPNNNADFTTDNSQWFKHKAALVWKTANAVNSCLQNAKIVVQLKYLCNFWISLEMSLIKWKIHLE